MDVQKVLGLLLLVILSSCSKPKTVEDVVVTEQASECSGQSLEGRYIVDWEDGHTTVETGASLEDFKKDFIAPQLENIRRVNLDQQVQFFKNQSEDLTGNFDASSSSVDLKAAAVPEDTWGQTMIESQAVWDQGILGQGVVVGVVDTYVDFNHKQLKKNIAYNTQEIPNNGVDDDQNGYIDDYAGMNFVPSTTQVAEVAEHGTHVSGVIAADHSQGPMKGIAPHSQIVPAPFLSATGGGSLGDAINALNYVAARGAKVINASWGSTTCAAALKGAFENLQNKGIVLVVAAGNSHSTLEDRPEFPAAFNLASQITVAASTPDDVMAGWSNNSFSLVHLAAPGEGIFSTVPQNSYKSMNGTSMAAPFVSGAAALLLSAQPAATPAEIKTALMRSVDTSQHLQFKVVSRGRLNIKKALEVLRSLHP